LRHFAANLFRFTVSLTLGFSQLNMTAKGWERGINSHLESTLATQLIRGTFAAV
jgi:hypothetical protein